MSKTVTPREFREIITSDPLEYISLIFNHHVYQVIERLRKMGYTVDTKDGAETILNRLINQGRVQEAVSAIDVENPHFDGLDESLKEVVFEIIKPKQ